MYATEHQTAHIQHPVLRGTTGYRIDDNHIELSIGEIANPRPEGDICGTLSLELWALNQPYDGGNFEGVEVAGTQVGQLFGQHFVANSQYRLDFQAPPIGSWCLTLMLREWTGAEFITRDFVNFSTPYVTSSAPEIVPTETDSVAALTPVAVEQPVARKRAAPKTSGATKTTKTNTATEITVVSINRATAAELKAIKGMPIKLVENIIAARPHKSLDALLDIKGMGPKLLEKLRQMLKL